MELDDLFGRVPLVELVTGQIRDLARREPVEVVEPVAVRDADDVATETVLDYQSGRDRLVGRGPGGIEDAGEGGAGVPGLTELGVELDEGIRNDGVGLGLFDELGHGRHCHRGGQRRNREIPGFRKTRTAWSAGRETSSRGQSPGGRMGWSWRDAQRAGVPETTSRVASLASSKDIPSATKVWTMLVTLFSGVARRARRMSSASAWEHSV